MAEEQNEAILAARAKLAAKFDSRIGGKGTQRRKVKAKTPNVVVNDDKKLVTQFKKMGLNPIPGIEEVNMFTDKNEVIHFKDPKVRPLVLYYHYVHASLQANTYGVSGTPENKTLSEMLPRVINQLGINNLGQENMGALKKVLEQSQQMAAAQQAASSSDIPDLEGTTFEDVAKVEDVEVD
eukprot:g7246.t1